MTDARRPVRPGHLRGRPAPRGVHRAAPRPSRSYWQDIPGEPGYWAVLTHADVVHVSRNPDLFSAEAGGWSLEDLDPERLARMRDMILSMDPPRHIAYRKPLAPEFRAEGDRRAWRTRSARSPARSSPRPPSGATSSWSTRSSGSLPTQVIGQLFGLPEADWDMLHAAGRAQHQRPGPRHQPGRGANAEAGQPRLVDADGHVRDGVRRRPPADASPRATSWTSSSASTFAGRHLDRRRHRQPARADGHRRQRHHGDDDRRGHLGPAPAPRAAGRAAGRPVADPRRGRGDPALAQPAALLPAHRHRGHRAQRHADRGGRQGGDVLHVGQPRREGLRRPASASTSTATRTPSCRSGSASTSASASTWPASRAGCSSRSCSPRSRPSSSPASPARTRSNLNNAFKSMPVRLATS